MRWREEHLLAGLARRLRGGMDGDTDPFELLIDCQDHLVLAARAYVDRLVLEAFADAVERAPEGERELLGRLCDLHALHLFERERGFFQEHGRFSSTRSKAVIKARQQRLRGARPARAAARRRVRDPRAVPGASARTIAGGASEPAQQPACADASSAARSASALRSASGAASASETA